ncbi:MAG: hypothetical protein R3B82_04190 [Sandaracinaceae bacterium]
MLALAGLGLWGCDGTTETDAGVTPLTDGGGGGTDAGPMTGGDPVGFGPMLTSLTAADFSCRGSVTAPADTGTEVSFTGVVTDFFNGMPVEGLTVQFFRDNTPTAACDGTCAESTSSATGEVTVTDNEGSWYGYRIVAGSGAQAGAPRDYIEVVQINEAAPGTGGSETLNAVQDSTRNTIITLLGVMAEPGTGTITGLLSDCNGESIANATIRLFDSSGEIALGSGRSGPRAIYVNGDSFPAAMQTSTHIDGLYGAANIPIPADGRVRVEIWGSLTAGGASEMLGCESVNVIEDGITIINVGPARSDGPTGCSM